VIVVDEIIPSFESQHAGPKLSTYSTDDDSSTTVAQNAQPGFLRSVMAFVPDGGGNANQACRNCSPNSNHQLM
jgi:hypothetical protein